MWYENILGTIGNTPLVRLNAVARGANPTILAKLEYMNPGGSVKDRIGIKMLEDAEKEGKIQPGGTVIEGTSGNTGMGLALAAAVKGYQCMFTMPDKMSQEKIDSLRAVGAEVIVTPTQVEHNDPRSYHSVARRLNNEIPNSIFPNQYENLSNSQAHYETTGREIWEQTEGKVNPRRDRCGNGRDHQRDCAVPERTEPRDSGDWCRSDRVHLRRDVRERKAARAAALQG